MPFFKVFPWLAPFALLCLTPLAGFSSYKIDAQTGPKKVQVELSRGDAQTRLGSADSRLGQLNRPEEKLLVAKAQTPPQKKA